MEYTTGKYGDVTMKTNKIIVYIGEERFRISESIDGKLTINKISDGLSDEIKIYPRSVNEVDIL